MKEKKVLTNEQIYKKNRQKAKIFKIVAPVLWYFLLIAFIVFTFLAFRHSVGNVVEIVNMLSKKDNNNTQIAANYKILAAKWGEWEVVAGGGVNIRYINIANALFSNLLYTFATTAVVCLIAGLVLGKVVFPALSKHYTSINEQLVDLASLKSAAQIDTLSKNKKEWF